MTDGIRVCDLPTVALFLVTGTISVDRPQSSRRRIALLNFLYKTYNYTKKLGLEPPPSRGTFSIFWKE